MAIDFTSMLSPNTNIRREVDEAKQKIDLLRAQNFNQAADVFEQTIIRKIQNKDPSIRGDFENLGQFYGANLKREGASAPPNPEDAAKRDAQLAAGRIEAAAVLKERQVAGLAPNAEEIGAAEKLFQTGQTEQAVQFLRKPLIEKQAEETKMFQQEEQASKQKETAEKRKLALSESEAAKRAAENKISKIEGLLKKDISDVVGATEPIARFGRAVASEMGASWAKENQKLMKDLNALSTDKVLDRARAVAPVTGTDLSFLKERVAPEEMDNELIWKDYLNEELAELKQVRDAFEQTIKSANKDASTSRTDTELLRARTKK
jgi:hypothetical protein